MRKLEIARRSAFEFVRGVHEYTYQFDNNAFPAEWASTTNNPYLGGSAMHPVVLRFREATTISARRWHGVPEQRCHTEFTGELLAYRDFATVLDVL
jgi:hypothetical protein